MGVTRISKVEIREPMKKIFRLQIRLCSFTVTVQDVA